MLFFFFFSSRRRHTRSLRDWSSDCALPISGSTARLVSRFRPPVPIFAFTSSETAARQLRSEEHTSELQSRRDLVCRLLLEKKKKKQYSPIFMIKKKNKQKN